MIPAAIAPKLAKLLPLLGSDNDGEVISTVRAIRRTLSAAGLDLHDLAQAVTADRRTIVASASFGPDFNFADAFKQSGPTARDPNNPDARTAKFGLPIYNLRRIEPWSSVATFCISQNWDTPKRHGGKLLTKTEIERLRVLQQGRGWPTNAEVAWIETIVARLHQAGDRHRAEGRRA